MSSARIDTRRSGPTIMRRGYRSLAMLPMYFAAFWMLMPLALVLVAPFSLHLKDPIFVSTYVLLNAICFCVGYRLLVSLPNPSPIQNRQTSVVRKIIHRGFWLALLLLPISVTVYTGKSIFDIASVLDQNAVYADLSEVIEEASTQRQIVSLVRGLAAPLTLAVIPLAAFYWSSLGTRSRWLGVGTAVTYMLFSAFRGTDKEMGDLIILSLTGVLTRAAFLQVSGKALSRRSSRQVLAAITAAITLFVVLFVFRKSERLGGFVAFCLYGDAACFEPSNSSGLGDVVSFGVAMFASYLVQGYYGLSLALPLDFEWTYGIGHSQPLQTIFGLFLDSKAIYEQGLMAQLRTVGWDDRYVWSSIFPALASDVSFAGVPVLFLIIGSIYGRSWTAAISSGHPASIVVFSLLTILVLYIPANSQITQSFDLYFAAVFWLVAFELRKRKHVRQ